MFQKGYKTCVSCHNSVRGGGSLTEYGKMVSSSQSLFGDKAFTQRSPGLLSFNGILDHGLKMRVAHLKTEFGQEVFPMQLDYLTTVKLQDWTLLSQVARAPSRKNRTRSENQPSEIDNYYFREFKVVGKLSSQKFLTIGRERQNLGLNLEDHTLLGKSLNRFSITDLTTVFSFDYLQDKYSFRSTLFIPNYQEKEGNSEYGLKQYLAFYSGNSYWGTGVLYGKTKSIARYTLNFVNKFKWKKFMSMAEVYITRRKTAQNIYFNQHTVFAGLYYFFKEGANLNIIGEYGERKSPFDSRQKRLGAGASVKLARYVSFRTDFKRTFFTRSNESLLISQIYVNWW
jgi:hypothetical protein